ncbi:MAG: hypothetical protein QW356_00770 [Candidatus Hadarchaeales archaeon]
MNLSLSDLRTIKTSLIREKLSLGEKIIITDYEYKVAEITPISPRDVKIPARSIPLSQLRFNARTIFNLFPPGTEIAVFSRRSPVGILRIGDENSSS